MAANQSVLQTLRKGPLKVSIVGSGNWGSVVGKIAAINSKASYLFHEDVRMWVFEEQVDGRNLSEIINTDHENVKYLPGKKLPENLRAVPNLKEAVADADMLVFVLPHQFLTRVLSEISQLSFSRPVNAISCTKGLHVDQEGRPHRCSEIISRYLNAPCLALSGANVAKDVANEEFSEATIGYQNRDLALVWQQLFDLPYFRVSGVPDIAGVEVCGAVKNVVALAAGFCDGMGLGTNTKSAIIRLGVEEVKLFAITFFEGITQETFFESCGLADVITTCFGGRNVRCAKEFVKSGGAKTWEQIEDESLGGQKLQGTLTTKEIYEVLEANKVVDMFPLFTATYRVAFQGAPPSTILTTFQNEIPPSLRAPEECSRCFLPEPVAAFRKRMRNFSTTPARL